jgi:prepilin-type N-terminal cleavage/methylation domain-containing protein/prepilin-type processing-associated H-X9-DG protein
MERNMKRTGFTLIELLVVIAIIAILAAILFPVFAKVREKARQTTCLSNEKQLGLAVQQYIQDYNERFPQAIYPYNNNPYNIGYSGVYGWAGQIYPYVKSDAAYTCPDDKGQSGPVTMSYAMNSNLGYGSASCGPGTYNSIVPKLSALQSVAKTVLIFEVTNANTTDPSKSTNTWGSEDSSTYGNGTTHGAGCVADGLSYTSTEYATGVFPQVSPGALSTGSGSYATQTGRHTDGANYLLADGHAKWYRPSAVSAGGDNPMASDQGTPVTAPLPNPTAANTGYSGNNTNPNFAVTFSYD